MFDGKLMVLSVVDSKNSGSEVNDSDDKDKAGLLVMMIKMMTMSTIPIIVITDNNYDDKDYEEDDADWILKCNCSDKIMTEVDDFIKLKS